MKIRRNDNVSINSVQGTQPAAISVSPPATRAPAEPVMPPEPVMAGDKLEMSQLAGGQGPADKTESAAGGLLQAMKNGALNVARFTGGALGTVLGGAAGAIGGAISGPIAYGKSAARDVDVTAWAVAKGVGAAIITSPATILAGAATGAVNGGYLYGHIGQDLIDKAANSQIVDLNERLEGHLENLPGTFFKALDSDM